MSAPHGHHGAEARPEFLEHHFDSPRQQFESHKTGMWLFLSTEILLFSGLFCAYSVYRANHPEIFIYAHQFLDKKLGALNTLVLILSSLTAAWAVRAAQLNQRKKLIGLIVATLVCACCFLGVKAIEYEHKWKHGLLWGERYRPHGLEDELGGAKSGTSVPAPGAAPVAGVKTGLTVPETGAATEAAKTAASAAPAASPVAPAAKAGSPVAQEGLNIHSNIPPAAEGPSGLARRGVPIGESGLELVGEEKVPAQTPRNVQVFFSIYFIMTGLHGLHVIAGMVAFSWVLRRAIRGDFSSQYYTAVDLTALYWHLVDLIWIYLFPLLYLIH